MEDINKENIENEDLKDEIKESANSSNSSNSSDNSDTNPPEFKLEQEWAETLGMNFDPERAAESTRPNEFPPQPDAFQPSQMPPQFGGGFNPQMMPPTEERPPMPPSYMLAAVMATLCCCMPAGVAAIVFSAMVSSRYYAGDYKGAERASRLAQIWIIVSIVVGIVVQTVYLPIMMVAGI